MHGHASSHYFDHFTLWHFQATAICSSHREKILPQLGPKSGILGFHAFLVFEYIAVRQSYIVPNHILHRPEAQHISFGLWTDGFSQCLQ